MLLQTRTQKKPFSTKTIVKLPSKENEPGQTYGMAIVLYLMYTGKEKLIFNIDGETCDPLVTVSDRDIAVRWIKPEDYELFCDWFDLINLSRDRVVFKRFTFALCNCFNDDWILCHTDDVNVLYGIRKACEYLKISTSKVVMRMYDGTTALI